eukprot:6703860-Prymnesium_polylepis.1
MSSTCRVSCSGSRSSCSDSWRTRPPAMAAVAMLMSGDDIRSRRNGRRQPELFSFELPGDGRSGELGCGVYVLPWDFGGLEGDELADEVSEAVPVGLALSLFPTLADMSNALSVRATLQLPSETHDWSIHVLQLVCARRAPVGALAARAARGRSLAPAGPKSE